MKRTLTTLGLSVLVATFASGQPAPATASPATTPPEVTVADVHTSAANATPFMDAGFVSRGIYQWRSATMLDLIAYAWGLDNESVSGGPTWLDSDRFDVIVKAPASSTKAERSRILRGILADRFKVVAHDDEKVLPVWALTVGKRGMKITESGGAREGLCKPTFDVGPPPLITVACFSMTMAEYADQLRMMAGGYLDHQVTDLTGLKGQFDITVKWSPRGAPRQGANPDAEPIANISIFDAVDKQLGLKLEAIKRPTRVVAVDSVNRAPSPNPPEAAKIAPEAAPEFEVADVKMNKSGSQMRRIQPKPGGRIEVENIPLKMLISLAWNMDEDRIVGAPKWAESDAYDILAKSAVLPGDQPPPFDTLRIMIRSLLLERFNMKVHNDEQPVAVWTLTVGKRGQKVKEADPASRSACKRATGETGTGANAIPALTYTCTNTTMAQLAEAMHNIAGGYVDHVAVDETGLKGGYDFSIAWTPRGVSEQNAQNRGADGTASDPMGITTFFEAVDKQLGLHLEKGQKRPLPVLVIDHAEPLEGSK
jgi:uncharacterized protein (TIGR03435 family)